MEWMYASVRLGDGNGVCGAEFVVYGFCVAQVLVVLDEASSMLCQQFLQSFPFAAGPVEVRAGNVVCGC